MLVLSRKRDESIMIGDGIELKVVAIRGDKVRLGITAPKGVPVHRREVYEAIQRMEHSDVEAATQASDGQAAGGPRDEPAGATDHPDSPAGT